MRYISDKIVFQKFRTFQFLYHGIEIFDQHFDLIFFSVFSNRLYPDAEISGGYSAGCISQTADRFAEDIATYDSRDKREQ